MIITTRTEQTIYHPQAHQHVPIETRVYVCDYVDDDGHHCPTAQEEGHAPEDAGRIPRGWRVVMRPGGQSQTQAPILCPKHSLSEIAGHEVEEWREPDITLAREMPKLELAR